MTKSRDPNRNISVLRKHIEESTRENSSACMVANAIKDAIPGAKKVHVDIQTIRYTDAKGVRRTWLTPGPAQAALCRYDAGDDVKPFRFSLNQLLHISRGVKRQEKVSVSVDAGRDAGATVLRPRRNGRQVPVLGNSTRRRFGIRNLRINQEGQVVQGGVIE